MSSLNNNHVVAGRSSSGPARITDWVLLAAFCGFLFFFGLSYFGLVGADEPRYAQIAREMLARHDWITPTLGNVPWLEKPVLYYWQAMLAYKVFGVSDWAARLPSAVDATLIVVTVFLFLRRFRPGFHLDGALMTASAAGMIGFSRAASTDMPLAATFTIALLAWYAWYESQRKLYLAFFYVFLGLGTLAKGPVAPFLAIVIIVLFALAKRDLHVVSRTFWLTGIMLYCVTALPWYIAVQLRNPDFFRVFILQHNLERLSTNRYHHSQPFWYYVPILAAGLVPWIVYVVAAGAENIQAWWAEKKEMLKSEDAFNVFLLIWLLVPFLFFSASQSKLPGYILPALPAGTLLLAEYLRHHVNQGEPLSAPLIFLHAVVAPLVPALIVQYTLLQIGMPFNRAAMISGGLGLVLAVGIALTLRLDSGLRSLRFVTLVPVILTVAAVLRLTAPVLDANLSARPLATEITRMENGALPAAVFRVPRETEYGLQFYRNQAIARYESGGVPSDPHLLVAPQGAGAKLARRFPDRRFSYLGSYQPQKLEYYWVSAPGMGMEHMRH